MRFSVTVMAITGKLPGATEARNGNERTILMDLRVLRTHFEALNTSSYAGNGLGKEVDKKMEVMKTCVDKVETALYGMIIRGQERPKGWVPDVTDEKALGEDL